MHETPIYLNTTPFLFLNNAAPFKGYAAAECIAVIEGVMGPAGYVNVDEVGLILYFMNGTDKEYAPER